MGRAPGIYVEILIRGDVEEVWRRTQQPDLHERWDVRFSSIRYLPLEAATAPQRFLYSTRIGFGLRIDGEGESSGDREDATGIRTSALKFWSADPKSLIEEGAGYWRYIPSDDGVRFLTWYDYRTRFGAAGCLVDRLIFRPLVGWGTAWSFDRLRRWIDDGLDPRAAMRLAAIHASARCGIAFVLLWHGLVTKLLYGQYGEEALMVATGAPAWTVSYLGAAEVAGALAAMVLWRWRGYFVCIALLMVAAIAPIVIRAPHWLVAPFGPVSLNAAMIVMSLAGYLAWKDAPSAIHCRRAPEVESK